MNTVIKNQEGSILYLTLNRPEKRNAMNTELVRELKQELTLASDDDHIRVIIIKGSGEAFCSGADLAYLQQLQQFTHEENVADSTSLAALFQLIYTHPKIVISQVEGAALAGGCGLATVCDFCFATPESKFGYTEVKIGFIPAIVSYFLLRKVGEANARKLMLTGQIMDAEAACKMQLVHEVVPAESIADTVKQFAAKLAKETSPSSIAITKKLISKIQAMEIAEAMQWASEQNAAARATEDCKKGIAAFLNKEKLTW